MGRGMKKHLLGPMDLAWHYNSNVTIWRAAHAADQLNLQSNFQAVSSVCRWWKNEQWTSWFRGQCCPRAIAGTCRMNVTVMKGKRCMKSAQKIGIEAVHFWSCASFELLFHGYERSNSWELPHCYHIGSRGVSTAVRMSSFKFKRVN